MTTSGDGGVLSEWKVETEAERSGKDALAVKVEKKEAERSGNDALARKLDKLEAMAERNSEKWQECKESIKVWQDKLMAIPPFPGEGEQNTLENWIEYRTRFQNICRLNKMSDSDSRLALQSAMRGTARYLVREVELEDLALFPTLKDVLDKYEQKLIPPTGSSEAKSLLLLAAQRATEPFSAFFQRTQILWDRAQPEPSDWESRKDFIISRVASSKIRNTLLGLKSRKLPKKEWLEQAERLDREVRTAELEALISTRVGMAKAAYAEEEKESRKTDSVSSDDHATPSAAPTPTPGLVAAIDSPTTDVVEETSFSTEIKKRDF